MFHRLEPIFDRVQRVSTRDELSEEIADIRDILDVEHVVYHSINSTEEQYAALTYEPDWVARYVEQDYSRIDPVVQACVRRVAPVDWKELDWTGKATRDFLDEALGAGVGNQGISVPIRGAGGQMAMFTVSHRCSDAAWTRYRDAHQRVLILAAHLLNQKALELERGSDEIALRQLSPRETESLHLIATGLSRAQAADTLSISEHTLRVYLESARYKLGAQNTTHAVARALVAGIIAPIP